jgi:hypothetical protein
MTKKAWIVAALLLLLAAAWGQEHTIYYSGDLHQGFITVTKDARGIITMTARFSKANEWRGGNSGHIESLEFEIMYTIDNTLCPLLPVGTSYFQQFSWFPAQVIIEGNTTTATWSNGFWEKTVVNGNTKTTTDANGGWVKTVVIGNTTTITDSHGHWEKLVTSGNTATWTDSYGGYVFKRVKSGNTITETRSDSVGWTKRVVTGNTTTVTSGNRVRGGYHFAYTRVVTRQGNSTHVEESYQAGFYD